MPAVFSRKQNRHIDYSLAVLQILIDSKKSELTAVETATALNDAKVLTHTGQHWTAEHVRASLKKIRRKEYRGKLYPAMLHLINAEKLTINECLPLYVMSRGGIAYGQ